MSIYAYVLQFMVLLHTSLPPGATGVAATPGVQLSCDIHLDGRAITLGEDSTITRAPLPSQFAVDSRGNIFGGTRGQVLEWAPDGRLLRAIGSSGSAPGQFAPGPVKVFIAPGDSLYVRDNRRRWVVFDPTFKHIRTTSTGPIVASSARETVFMENNLILSGFQVPGDTVYEVVVVDREGGLHGRHFPITDSTRTQPHARPIAYLGGGTYWLGPVEGPRDGYRIEKRDMAGKLLQQVVRDVPWFRAEPNHSPIVGEDQQQPFPFPNLSQFYHDGRGFLWAMVASPNSQWNPERRREWERAVGPAQDSILRSVLDLRIEVLDTARGTVLASSLVPASAMIDGVVPGTRLAFRFGRSSTGRREVHFFSLGLTGPQGGTCR